MKDVMDEGYTVSMGQILDEGAMVDHKMFADEFGGTFDLSGRYPYTVAKQRGIGVPIDAPIEEALVVGSMTSYAPFDWLSDEDGEPLHKPVIDLDIPVRYFPSSTPGHGHLYVDKYMCFEDMMKLLRVMQEVGLVERGFVESTKARGEAYVRLPWVRKGEPFPKPSEEVADDGGW